MIGQTISHYKILEQLGEGGMGVVCRAEDVALKREVAIKFLPPHLTQDPIIKKRFIQEAQAASSLDHANICTIHEIGETENGQTFIVMACYEGETLREKIDLGPLSVNETLKIAKQIARGLVSAHEKGIVHRDLKPSNIFLTPDGTVKIIDFGLAKLTGLNQMTREGTTLGTAAYMSPEQASGGKVDQRSDIWSLGVVLYEMITGLRPFQGDYEQAVLYAILNEDPKPLTALRTGIPLELERIVTKMLTKNPDKRYQHIDEILVDVQQLQQSLSGMAVNRETTAEVSNKSFGKGFIVSTFAVIVLIGAVFLLRPTFFEQTIASDPKPIAVLAFANQTGDSSYDYLREAIPNLLITSLEQSKYLRVMTWERMKDVLEQMGKSSESPLTKEIGFELCQREGISAIVIGSFIKAGQTFATDVKVLDVSSKELLKSVSARGDGVQSILDKQIDQLSKEIARGVGLTQRSMETVPTNIVSVTTSSLEAYNWFLRGRQESEALNYVDARESLERAVALDSNFAMAYFYLSEIYNEMFGLNKARQAIQKAKTLSKRAPQKERLLIDSYYARLVENDPDKGFQLLQELVRKYLTEKRFHFQLAAELHSQRKVDEAEREYKKAIQLDPEYAAPINSLAYLYSIQGQYEKALQTLQRYVALSPDDANPHDSMGEIYFRMGNLEESLKHYQKAVQIQPSFYSAYSSLVYIFSLQEKYNRALEYVDRFIEKSPTTTLRAIATAWKVKNLNYRGRYHEARQECDKIKQLMFLMDDSAEFAVTYHWVKGRSAYDHRNFEKAKQEFVLYNQNITKTNLEIPVFQTTIGNYHLGMINLQQGNVQNARIYLEKAKKTLDQIEILKNTLQMNCGLLEAELLLAEGHPHKAIKAYHNTQELESIPAFRGLALAMYNEPPLRDVIPRAFLVLGKLDSAIIAYQELIQFNPHSKDRHIPHPLYHYRLAQVYEQAGKIDEAKSEYQRFLELWKDADADRPALIDAKKRFAKLPEKI